jgi:hypothetical protein
MKFDWRWAAWFLISLSGAIAVLVMAGLNEESEARHDPAAQVIKAGTSSPGR